MTQETRELLERALKLPAEDRALLAGALEASLAEDDGLSDPEVAAAWRDEIARRLREYREGSVTPISADTVHADALTAIARARRRGGSPSS